MERERLRQNVVRYGLLFVICIVLVAGFWFHAEFYQIGFYPLLLLGGFVTFLVVISVRALATGSFRRRRAQGAIPLTREAGERVLAGTQTMAILPAASEVPPVGTVANAVVVTSGQQVARVAIKDLRRRLAADVRDDEAAAAGFDSAEEFVRVWTRGRKTDPREVVLLVRFKREAAR
jgi:NADH:ubiquinone oxidoreductase subunit 6 (subunit J)